MKKSALFLFLSVFAFCSQAYPSKLKDAFIIAHRGGMERGMVENTLDAFQRSYDAGIRGFETDVRITKDGHLVILHNKTPKHIFGLDKAIESMTLEEVSKLRSKKGGHPLPTLEQILDFFADKPGCYIEWEMKTSDHKTYTSELLKEYCRKLHDRALAKKPADSVYAFTSFDIEALETMRAIDPDCDIGYITGKPCDEKCIAIAKKVKATRICCGNARTTRKMVQEAQKAGFQVNVWPGMTLKDYYLAKGLGANICCVNIPVTVREHQMAAKRLVCIDLDGTLTQHRSPLEKENREVLEKLMRRYKCVMVGAGNAPRIYKQMGNFPIEIIGNYGMQESKIVDGEFRIVKQVTNTVDKAFFAEKTDYLRKKYGYTEFAGNSVEFHPSGMVTFALLGTKADRADKLVFDRDRAKRRKMYPEVLKIFKDYSVYIGGTTSFDIAPLRYNKYDAVLDYAKRNGYTLDEIVFIGDDLEDGGGDSHVRIKGMDFIQVVDYKRFPKNVEILLK
jgi:glycerophosphoryl diester phosphodiesterase